MFNKSKQDWASRTFCAGVGATLAASISIAHGQPPLVSLMVISGATIFTLLLDDLGII
ncbi:MAG: hypothetical protein NW237_05245 [Cyanobacteriota bacterium]|nr:hypothetical protein [Cyanobacteriota bacterium]